MDFQLAPYTAPDFAALSLENAPDARLARVEKDFVAPENYHATTIFPEYFKVGGSSFGRSQSRTPTAATRPSRKL